jgi:hypothetical protein
LGLPGNLQLWEEPNWELCTVGAERRRGMMIEKRCGGEETVGEAFLVGFLECVWYRCLKHRNCVFSGLALCLSVCG